MKRDFAKLGKQPTPEIRAEQALSITKAEESVTCTKAARAPSEASIGGTPRSSGEIYSLSNISSGSLASERPYRSIEHSSVNNTPSRRVSQRNARHQQQPECLMMGYAHVQGSFALDGSLVNQASFEEVKRKGVLGGYGGGGVVGVEKTKANSSLLGTFGLSNIGQSLGGLLGEEEPSSIREMRGIANSKAIPLISTPQSILFVDLRLNPGESRSYSFSFTLPVGLPPTFKGKAIKISYNLILGTQRAGTDDGKYVKQVEVPFRVLGSVNGIFKRIFAVSGYYRLNVNRSR